ncbi:ABC transporter substrate-binding protein [Prosthecomicrobium hirschii]|uniref:ABC transporter substrate-binding protein n=1 Tax=Prosthecodimorpha hirschii TaxID=665126 RepID=UPI0022200640|nr:ABC transporter substrate-binding protein [Prosthecomicrobium hirschii]MCW1840393.1 ABC transporter substrate-binding protein [Prosthecomicrobium hirschii]
MSLSLRNSTIAAVLTIGLTGTAGAEELVVGSFGGSFADNVKACHVAAFEKATGATVALKLGNSSQFAAAVRATGGKPDMDIVYIDNSLAAQLNGEGLADKIDRTKLKSAPDVIASAWGKNDSYVVAMVSATALVYNPKLVKAPPSSWLDLADPAYAGKYAIGDITGTSGLHYLLAVNKAKGGTLDNTDPGFEAIKPIAKGSAVLYTQADQLLALFEREEIAVAPWYPDRAGVAMDKGLSLAVAYPKEGAVGILPAVVIPKGTAKADLALKFLDQILSAEGQGCFSEKAYIGAVNTKVKLSDKVAKIVPNGESLEKAWFIDPELIAKNSANWTRRWQREVAR